MLTEHGHAQCLSVAENIRNLSDTPDLVLASSATRTRQTAENLCAAQAISSIYVQYDEKLYLATPGDLMHIIHTLPEGIHHVLLIGHNPGLYQLAISLCEGSQQALGSDLPTGGMVALSFPVTSWSEITPDSGTLVNACQP